MFNEMFDGSLWLRIVFSIACGTIIGVERQMRGKAVGIRTSILICLGTTIFIYLGMQIDGGKDLSRILGQIVTGIGFLGAGVIMTKEGLVSGVTSASVVWILAGTGAAIGLEHYGLAVVVCFITWGILVGVEHLESIFKNLQRGEHRHGNGQS